MPTQMDELLLQFGIKKKEWVASGLVWADLERIRDDHTQRIAQLENATEYLLKELRRASPLVHSTRGRVKDPDGLIAKIIRKRLEDPDRDYLVTNYQTQVTDLVGVRVLHLFKSDWRRTHEAVRDTWHLHEDPIAYIREGDSNRLSAEFGNWGLVVKVHPAGYRSVHYLIRHQLSTSSMLIAEVQVRTLAEVAWSEIDHQIRYPRGVNSDSIVEALGLLNRMAGVTDETAAFIGANFTRWERTAKEESKIDLADLEALSWWVSVPLERLRHLLFQSAAAEPASKERVSSGIEKIPLARRALAQMDVLPTPEDTLQKYYLDNDSGLQRYSYCVENKTVITSVFSTNTRVAMTTP